MSREFYVYLKLQNYTGTDITIDTIPLRATSVGVTVQKSIPSFDVPFSGFATGESVTYALDIGNSNKKIDIQGFIVNDKLKRSHTKDGSDNVEELTFHAMEIAQMIASGVDASGRAKYQAFDELVVLTDSLIDENYDARSSSTLIPLSFRARGSSGELDNKGVPLASDFPTTSTSQGLRGYVDNFSYTLEAETVEVAFQMSFTVANVLPRSQ